MEATRIARLRLLGLVFCLAGGTAIALGWAGTAQVTCVDCQVPYLISGGAGGIALTVLGTGLLVIAQLRVEGTRLAERMASATSAGDGDGDGDRPPAEATGDAVAPLTLASDRPATGRPATLRPEEQTAPLDLPEPAYQRRVPE